MVKNQIEEVKKLLKMGFEDLELISFELSIPIEEVKKIKNEIDKKQNLSQDIDDVKLKERYEKIKKIRERYKSLYYKKEESAQKEIHSYDEIQKLYESVQDTLTTIGKNIKSADRQKINREGKIRRLANEVDMLQAQTESIEELKFLSTFITKEMKNIDPIFAGSVSRKIDNKIQAIEQEVAYQKYRDVTAKDAIKLAKNIADGTLNLEKLNTSDQSDINKNDINQSKEQLKMLKQVKALLEEKATEYPIQNSEDAIKKIQTVFKATIEQAMPIVVQNLIQNKKFDEAKHICEEAEKFLKEGNISIITRILKVQIRNAQISDMVLKGINMQGTPEEIVKYFDLIEKGIKQANISMEKISLGKSEDGRRKIALSDVWISREGIEK